MTCPAGKILNPDTGRCVLRTGKIGQKVLRRKKSPKSVSHKSVSHKSASHKSVSHKSVSHKSASHKSASHKSVSHKSASHKSVSHKSASHKSVSHKSVSHKSVCPAGKILNPDTGRCVLRTGKIGQKVLFPTVARYEVLGRKSCPAEKILNPDTGRCVLRTGKIGQQILAPMGIEDLRCKPTRCRKEVQAHGFTWEKELITNVYHATPEEQKSIKYNSKMDLPSEFNHLDNCDISIKTSCSINTVCMADCLRVYDAVSSEKPIHLVVILYKQNDTTNTKKISTIVEVDLTNSCKLLFGTISRYQIVELDKVVKSVPQKRKPTEDEYKNMYLLRDRLQEKSGAIHLDIKCNSTQSRLQCSFNHFQNFLEKNASKVIAKSNNNEFRGGVISSEIKSDRRVL